MRVFITGGTGFIGRALTAVLAARGDEVVVLTRDPERHRDSFAETEIELIEGNPQYAGDWQKAVDGCDAVVHLAGEAVAGRRWDARFKQRILDSRVDSTRFVVEAIASAASRPAVLVSASGIDFYPWAEELDAYTARFEDDDVAEDAPPGSSYLARVCREWEKEAYSVHDTGARVVLMRTGLVLGRGGALDRLAAVFKVFLGGQLGSGRQWVSWIDLADVVRAYVFALDSDHLAGPVNLVAPNNVRNRGFSAAVGNILGRPSWLPTPTFVLKVAVGEFAEYLVHGRKAVPARLLAAGFEFQFVDVETSLARHLQ